MAKPIMDLNKLEQLKEMERKDLERSRWKTRDTNPMVQMSIRMEEDEYLKFRALCKQERRTNGEMVQHLMEAYLPDA